jgi:hypothetical protein
MPKSAGSGLLSGPRREERPTVSPADTGTRPSKLRFEHKRHMYFDGKKWLPSVTGITDKAEDKSRLIDWAAGTVATCAIDEAAELSRIRRLQSDEAAHEWLSNAANRYRDGRGVNGSDLHDVVDRKLSGQDVPEYLHGDIEKMADNAIAFLNDYSVQVLFSEVRLANRLLGCCGTTDLLGIVPVYGTKPLVIDWKSAESMYRNPRYSRGKNSMQLCLQAHAEVMFWDDRTEADMIATDPTGLIVMIRPEGYKVEDFDLNQAWPQFQRAIENYHWWRGAEALGRPARAPLALPISEAACPVHGPHGGTVDCIDCLHPTDLMAVIENPKCTVEMARDLMAQHKGGLWVAEHTAFCLQRWPRKAA